MIRALILSISLMMIAPFFIKVYPQRPTVSFDYFLDELEFIEGSLWDLEWKPSTYQRGDFTLESVITSEGLKEDYLSFFETDIETARLGGRPYVIFAFSDRGGDPIRIWIDGDSYRVYTTGQDGISESGGLDPDDVWTGEPDKARKFAHEAYQASWLENNRQGLWSFLIDSIRRRRA